MGKTAEEHICEEYSVSLHTLSVENNVDMCVHWLISDEIRVPQIGVTKSSFCSYDFRNWKNTFFESDVYILCWWNIVTNFFGFSRRLFFLK